MIPRDNLPQQQNQTDFELGNVEGFYSGEQKFSHSALIMKGFNIVIDRAVKELHEGIYEKEETQKGTKIVYKEDTRKAFIESVKTLKMLMVSDFDKEAIEDIKKIEIKIKEKYKYFLVQQKNWWENLNYTKRLEYSKEGLEPNPGFLNKWYQDTYLFEELDLYREMVEALTILSKRLNYYETDKTES